MARPPRWNREEWDEATIRLLGRDGDTCHWCRSPLKGDAHRHHRMRRKEGGDRIENLVLLHARCHADVHSQVDESRRRGFIVPTWSDPLTTPIEMKGVGWVLLTSEGTRMANPR